MMTLFERIYERHFGLVVAPLSYEKKITFFLPSDQALDRIPGGKLLTLSGENLAEVCDILWTMSSEKLHVDMQKFRLSHACTKYHLGLCHYENKPIQIY